MFTSDFKEKQSNSAIVKNISPEAFLDFLYFLYTDTVKDLKSHVIELLAIADLYEVEDLKTICQKQMLNGLSDENAADIFQYAHRYRCEKNLKEAAFKIIKQYF